MSYDECSEDEMIQEHDLRYIWKCPKCGHEYEDVPGYNEASLCSCGDVHECVGETYACD